LNIPEKKSFLYQERNEEERAVFLETIKGYAKERLVYVDESGIDDTLNYMYGYAHKSKRYPAERLGHKTKRISLISGWREGEIIAPLMFEGYCNSQLFCQWVEECLVPELIPGQIVLLDNASFHPKKKIEKLIRKTGCEVIFLPKYSPDLNKIEKFWAQIKHKIKKLKREQQDLTKAIKKAFKE
jgi:transposase